MNERDQEMKIQSLIREVAKWKQRAKDTAQVACFECREYSGKKKCDDRCPAKTILVEEGIYGIVMDEIAGKESEEERKESKDA